MGNGLEDLKTMQQSEEWGMLLEASELIAPINDEKYEEISLSDFETYILPYIIGAIEHNEENETIFKHNFYKIIGSYSNPLYVIDNGEILYKLPPLIYSNDVKITNNINFGLLYTAQIAANDRGISPILAKGMDIIGDISKPNVEKVKPYLNDMRRIFTDYKHLIKNEVTKDTPKKEIEDDDLDDFLS